MDVYAMNGKKCRLDRTGVAIETLESRVLLHGTINPLVAPVPAVDTVDTLSATAIADGWTDGAPAPAAVFESVAAAVNGKIYEFGGFINARIQATDQASVYDAATDQWAPLADSQAPESHVGTTTDGQIIYFAGGFRGDWFGHASADVFQYDTTTGQWTRGLSLPSERGAGALVLVGRQLHFFGGLKADGLTDSADHWVFDLDNPAERWVSKAPLPDPRNHLGYAVLNGKIYAIGGQHALDEDNGQDAAVSVYDPATDSWTDAAPLPVRRSHLHNSTVVYQGKIICVGGSDVGNVASDDILMYDPATNQWSTIGHLPAARSAAIAQVVGDELIVTTGTPTGVLPQIDTWKWSLKLLSTPDPDGNGGTVGATPEGLTPRIVTELPASVVAGSSSKLTVAVKNDTAAALRNKVATDVYLSTDTTLDDGDILVGVASKRLNLAVGAETAYRVNVKFVASLPEGSYYILADARPGIGAARSLAAAGHIAISAGPVAIRAPFVDLSIQASLPPGELVPGARTTLALAVTNSGNVAWTSPMTISVTATGASQPADSAIALSKVTRSFKIRPSQTHGGFIAIQLPAKIAAGSYALTIQVNGSGLMKDADPANNAVNVPLTVL